MPSESEGVMKALILNSGVGRRMGEMTKEHPKCMTEIKYGETILSMQLKQLFAVGVKDVVITTGLFADKIETYCKSLELDMKFTFVSNPIYDKTNYIYSIYLARQELQDDLLLMHGDLVFTPDVLDAVISSEQSCMTISTTLPLPEKDFKAVVKDGQIIKVGIDFFDHAYAAQPLYKLLKRDWSVWLKRIGEFCEAGVNTCYAENALNEVSECCIIQALDIRGHLCNEIDTPEDWKAIKKRLEEEE